MKKNEHCAIIENSRKECSEAIKKALNNNKQQGCQFEGDFPTLYGYKGEYFCIFHLPLEAKKDGKESSKFNDDFKIAIKKGIANFSFIQGKIQIDGQRENAEINRNLIDYFNLTGTRLWSPKILNLNSVKRLDLSFSEIHGISLIEKCQLDFFYLENSSVESYFEISDCAIKNLIITESRFTFESTGYALCLMLNEYNLFKSIKLEKFLWKIQNVTSKIGHTPSNSNRKAKTLYIKPTNAGLRYEVIGLDKALKKGWIPWSKLPMDFPKNFDKAETAKPYLANLLQITSKAGHTQNMIRVDEGNYAVQLKKLHSKKFSCINCKYELSLVMKYCQIEEVVFYKTKFYSCPTMLLDGEILKKLTLPKAEDFYLKPLLKQYREKKLKKAEENNIWNDQYQKFSEIYELTKKKKYVRRASYLFFFNEKLATKDQKNS